MLKSMEKLFIRYSWIFIALVIIGVAIMTATILPVSAQSTGTISGYVINQITEVPIQNMKVGVGSDSWGAATCTDETGYYIIDGLPFNTPFNISAGGSDNDCAGGVNNYAPEYWQETLGWGDATPITLYGNTPNVTGINFTLEFGGSISGQVTNQSTGSGIPNMQVYANFDSWELYTCTDANGNYTISAMPPNASFRMVAGGQWNGCDNGTTDYIQEYWQDTFDDKSAVVFSLDNTHPLDTTGINFSLETGGTVSGQVIDQATNEPISNMTLGVYFDGWGTGTCTDANGNYTFSAPLNEPFRLGAGGIRGCENGPNNYVEELWPEAFDWGGAVVFSLGDTHPANMENIDFSLEVGGTVSGWVTDQTSEEGISNIIIWANFSDWNMGTCTDTTGFYIIGPLPLDTSFRLSAGSSNSWCEGGASPYIEEYWQESPDQIGAFEFSLGDMPPNTHPANTENINFTLELGGSVSGRVTLEGNPSQGIPNMGVHVNGNGFHIGVCTDQDGYYTASGVPLHTDFRMVTGDDSSDWCGGVATNYIQEWWWETDWNDAFVFSLGDTHPVDTTDIDFTLEVGGTVSGTVINEDTGLPFANLNVGAFNDNFGTGACTDSNGDYTMYGIPLDTPLHITAGGLNNHCGGPINTVWTHWEQTVFFDNATLETLTAANPDLTGINFTVELGGTVSGRVIDQNTQQPIANMPVTLGPLYNGVCTDADGNYTLYGIPLDTPFTVRAGDSDGNFCGEQTNYVDEYWQETFGGPGTQITLDSNNRDLTDIDFTLQVGGTISGQVIDQITEQGIPNFIVRVYLDNGGYSTCTDQTGHYTLNIPLNTDFRIGAGYFNWCGGAIDYIQEFWEENPDYYSSIVISLGNTHPVITTDINFTLEKGGTISGRVTDQITGEGIPNMRIDAYIDGVMSTWSACTDESGYYTTDAMPYNTAIKVSAGRDYNYCGGSNDYSEEYYDGADGTYNVALALPVTIPIDGHIFSVDIPLGASDSDGVDSDVEDGAPNNGDGNGDGIPDSQQDDVASLPNAVDSEYVTIDADGSTLTNVEATTNPDTSGSPLPPMIEAPVGFFSFDVDGLTPAQSIMITMYLPEGTIVESYYKFGPTPDNPTQHWYEFLYDGTTGAQIMGNVIYLYLVDGQRGDSDMTANGYIEDPGMPVMVNAAILMVDIMPGDSLTCYNRDGHGNIPVAILGMASFDVHQIIPETVTLDSMGIRFVGKHEHPQFSYEDVNGDGFIDLLVHIEDDGLVYEGNTTGVVNALLESGFYIRGFDEVCVEQ